MTIDNAPRRGNELLAQGIALGIDGEVNLRPVRAKAPHHQMLLPFQGVAVATCIPRALPWAGGLLAFQAVPTVSSDAGRASLQMFLSVFQKMINLYGNKEMYSHEPHRHHPGGGEAAGHDSQLC